MSDRINHAGMAAAIPATARWAWIVEDDPDFTRQIIEALTNLSGFWRVASFATGAAILEYGLSRDSGPDLILVDMGLPDIGGAEVIRALHARFPESLILVISVIDSEQRVIEAITSGALGYLLKGDSSLGMSRGIAEVMQGNYPISPKLARYLFKLAARPQASNQTAANMPRLTPRETELLQHIADGCSYTEAADNMGISLSTVQSNIRNLYRKLDVHSQVQAVTKARDHGLLSE